MAPKNTNQNPATEAAAAPAPRMTTRRLPQVSHFSDYAEKWEGYSPADLDPSVENANVEKIELADLVDFEITFHGFVKKSGQTGDFVVACCTHPEHEKPFVIVTGAGVLVKKLSIVAEKNGFPVAGRVVVRKGKRYNYFDVE
jgi:hypothetical protein